MLSVFAGLGLGLSLIIAIGAQNIFVLRQGIRREHILAVVIICAVSDAVLILAGVAGLGALIASAPWLVPVARCAGALFLVAYAALAARRAWRGGGHLAAADDADAVNEASRDSSGPSPAAKMLGHTEAVATASTLQTHRPTRLMPVVLTVLALTWLNPHVYLDTVLMLGSIAATYGDDRWLFGAGAVTASALWFTSLGFGARYLGRWLRTERSWRIVDALIAVVMLAIAIGLAAPLFS